MEEFSIVESRPKELFTDMPVVWLRPLVGRERPEVCSDPESRGIQETPAHLSAPPQHVL